MGGGCRSVLCATPSFVPATKRFQYRPFSRVTQLAVAECADLGTGGLEDLKKTGICTTCVTLFRGSVTGIRCLTAAVDATDGAQHATTRTASGANAHGAQGAGAGEPFDTFVETAQAHGNEPT